MLFSLVLTNIESVETTDDMTVVVKMKEPWVAFPSYLYGSSRVGIMAQAQLDSVDDCGSKPIGTGPFSFVSWNQNDKLVAERNENYWQIAPDGEPYPYVDRLEFRPITDGQIRNTSLEAGDINMMHTSNAKDIGDKLRKLRDAGKVNMFVSEEYAEVAFLQLNHTKPPFDDPRVRRAIAMGADRDQINQIMNDGLPTIANGPISTGTLGYLEDTGFPAYNKEEARKLVEEYVAEGKDPSFTLSATNDAAVKQLAELVQTRAKDIGVKVEIRIRDQASLINDAIGREYDAMTFRNYPGGDPDSSTSGSTAVEPTRRATPPTW